MRLIAFFFVLLVAFRCPAEDGFTSGELKTAQGVVTGTYVCLTADGKPVYMRSFGKKSNPSESKKAPFTESLLIDGITVLELHHSGGRVRTSISGNDKYEVHIDFSPDSTTIQRITVVPKAHMHEYVWEPDAQGFFADYRSRSVAPPRF